jgi:flagellar biosynthesis protein FliQ
VIAAAAKVAVLLAALFLFGPYLVNLVFDFVADAIDDWRDVISWCRDAIFR